MANEIIDGATGQPLTSVETDLTEGIKEILKRLNTEEPKQVLSTLSEFRFKPFRCNSGHFVNLFQKVRQELSVLLLMREEVEVTIRYGNDSLLAFASLDEFREHEKSETEYIKEIVLNFDCRGQKAGTEDIERFILEVALRAEFSSHDFRLSALLTDSPPNNIRWNVGFSDYVLAKNISHTIEAWLNSLPKFPENQFSVKMGRASYKSFFNTIFALIPLVAVSFFAYFVIIKTAPSSLGSWVNWALLAVLIFSITHITLAVLKTKFEKRIHDTCPVAAFEITSGDKNRIDSIESKNKTNITKALAFLALSLFAIPFNAIAGVLTQYFISWFKGIP